MKGKPLEMSLLFDFYGETLTEKQRELFDLYYNEDLSLAEIAEHAGITRQGVRDSIKRAEHALGLVIIGAVLLDVTRERMEAKARRLATK